MTTAEKKEFIKDDNDNFHLTATILNNSKKITEAFIKFYCNVENRLDSYGITNDSPIMIESKIINKVLLGLKKKGIQIRHITEIKPDNIKYCKQMMDIVELRHIDGMLGGMMVNDSEYIAIATMGNINNSPNHFYSNDKQIVNQQKQIFDILWDKAIPAIQKINQIEEGIEPDIIEIIKEPIKVKSQYLKMLKSVSNEMLILFPTHNFLFNSKNTGFFEIINKIPKIDEEKKIKIIIPTNEFIENDVRKLEQKISQTKISIEIRFLKKEHVNISSNKNAMILIFDRNKALVIDHQNFHDDEHNVFELVWGAANTIYSTSKTIVSSYTFIFDNLWEQAELYQQLTEAHQNLKLHDKMQKEFIYTVSHELRTPIQPILGLSQILLSKQGNINDYIDLISVIYINSERLKKLVDNIIDVMVIEGQSLVLHKQKFKINDLILDIIFNYNENKSTNINNNEIVFSSPSFEDNEDIVIYSDKECLFKIIDNIVGNAIKFTTNGKIIIKIRKLSNKQQKTDVDKDHLLVSIEDNGIGINPNDINRIFSKFYTTSIDGIGLGLYISKSLVVKLGGQIWLAHNEEGKGVTFSFTIPL
ncbi:MAG: HAMP domain-containing histidine kinase [Nitrosopumilus sp.]|nr:HAMP domain-containing histidine kinase [Nitrosopumilus sp.]